MINIRNKGRRVENEIVADHLSRGIKCERVPLSGASGGSFSSDLIMPEHSSGLVTAEIKSRKSSGGFRTLEAWLHQSNANILIIRQDRKSPLVVMPYEQYFRLVWST